MFFIQDWAGHTCFQGKTFVSFDDAEDFLSEMLSDAYDDCRGEYEVTEGMPRAKRYLDPRDPRAS